MTSSSITSGIPSPQAPLADKRGLADSRWYLYWANLANQSSVVNNTTVVSGVISTSLAALSDVVLSAPLNNQVLIYRYGKWINAYLPTNGTGGSVQIQSNGTLVNQNANALNFAGSGVTLNNSADFLTESIVIPGLELVQGTISASGTITVGSGLTLNAGGTLTSGGSTMGSSQIYAPLVNGDLPGPGIMADPLGQCIMVGL